MLASYSSIVEPNTQHKIAVYGAPSGFAASVVRRICKATTPQHKAYDRAFIRFRNRIHPVFITSKGTLYIMYSVCVSVRQTGLRIRN